MRFFILQVPSGAGFRFYGVVKDAQEHFLSGL